MGAGGEAGRPDSPDDLALFHARAGPNVGRDGAQMGVARPDLSGMPKLDKASIRAHESRPGDDPRCRGFDLRSVRRAIVDPLVRPPQLEDGMKAASREVAGDAIGHRIAQERSAQGATFLVEIGEAPAGRRLRDGPQDAVAVPKLDGEKVTASDRAVGPELSLQGQPHGIAAPQVPREVHLPGEYVRDVIDQLFKVRLPEAIQVAAEASRPEARLDGAG